MLLVTKSTVMAIQSKHISFLFSLVQLPTFHELFSSRLMAGQAKINSFKSLWITFNNS